MIDKASFAAGVELLRHKRRMRKVRFVVCETIAMAVIVAWVLAGSSAPFASENLTPIFRVIPVCAVTAAVILPVLFFANPKRRNRHVDDTNGR
jgi:hypothetical protein